MIDEVTVHGISVSCLVIAKIIVCTYYVRSQGPLHNVILSFTTLTQGTVITLVMYHVQSYTRSLSSSTYIVIKIMFSKQITAVFILSSDEKYRPHAKFHG